jgi:hypothetical protein
VILNKANDKQPITQLINLCHDLISQSDYLIFEQPSQGGSGHGNPIDNLGLGGGGSYLQISDPNQSMNSLRQLTKRMRVNLVYDPSKSTSVASSAAISGKKTPAREAAMSGVSFEEPLMPPPTTLTKAVSHQPAFIHLADQSASSALDQQPLSKVYQKRNFIYSELKSFTASVEQCASLFLLEDFLRNRIKTMEDVRTLKVPPLYGQPSSSHLESSNSSLPRHRLIRHLIERLLDQMRDLLESTDGLNREEIRAENERFNHTVVR